MRHIRMRDFHKTLAPFFTEATAAEDNAAHNTALEIRTDTKASWLKEDEYEGQYLGTMNLIGKSDGRGLFLDADPVGTLYEGIWKKGVKHGRFREIKPCQSKPFMKIKEGVYVDGEL